MGAPSTAWKEVVPEGEEARFARYAEQLVALQKPAGGSAATARALHAKSTGGFSAELEIFGDLPEHARAGLFARPRTYQAQVRFSNGAGRRQADRTGDVRGVALKILGVEGKKVLGDASTQDLLLIGAPATPFRTADEFVTVVLAAARPATLLFKVLGALGPVRTFQILSRFAKSSGAPVATLAGLRFFSAVPIRVGAYAARYALTPRQATGEPIPERGPEYLSTDLAARLRQGSLTWDLELQFFEDEATTPIEDSSVDWTSPYVTVGQLTLPKQDASSPEGLALARELESLSFDPWHALVEHTPLGGMMRARKHAYFASTQARAARPDAPAG